MLRAGSHAPSVRTARVYVFPSIDAPSAELFHVTFTAAIVVAVRWGGSDLRSDASDAARRVRRARPFRPR